MPSRSNCSRQTVNHDPLGSSTIALGDVWSRLVEVERKRQPVWSGSKDAEGREGDSVEEATGSA